MPIDTRQEAAHLLNLGAKKKKVQQNMIAKTGKVILLKDLSNIYSKASNDSHKNGLDYVVKDVLEKFGMHLKLM